ncbi:MAG: hypothetical protein IJ512_03865 [Ruminococcus sp.]|nr:hypothetical protein [Ruminococcus sp.]
MNWKNVSANGENLSANISILKQHSDKIRVAGKRRRCSYDDAFLASV